MKKITGLLSNSIKFPKGDFMIYFTQLVFRCFVVSDLPSFLISRSKLWGTGTPNLA